MYVVDVIGSVSPDEPTPPRAPAKPTNPPRWPALLIASAIGLTTAIVIIATPKARRR